jgi:hypothetical protein
MKAGKSKLKLYAIIENVPYGQYVHVIRAKTKGRAIKIANCRETIAEIKLLSNKGSEKLILTGGSSE